MQLIKNLFSSWLDSLRIFLPANLKPFLLISLKSTWDAWVTIFSNFILLVFFLVLLIAQYLFLPANNLIFYTINAIFILALRPSVDYKNPAYFYFQFLKIAFSILLILISSLFFNDLNLLFIFLKFQRSHLAKTFLSPFITFIFLFVYDAQNKLTEYFKAIYRALKMFIYNYPFCLILFFIFDYLFFYLTKFLWIIFAKAFFLPGNIENNIQLISYKLLLGDILFLIILPFYLSLLVNYYIKEIHDKFSLYYKKE